jgi:hypothetical protein
MTKDRKSLIPYHGIDSSGNLFHSGINSSPGINFYERRPYTHEHIKVKPQFLPCQFRVKNKQTVTVISFEVFFQQKELFFHFITLQ